MCEPLIDRLLKFIGAVEGTSTNHPSGDQSKESFDLIQPGTAGRCEVEVEAAPPFRFEPALDLSALVCAVIVHDQVHFLIVGKLPFQVMQEANELAAAVTLGSPDSPLKVAALA